MPKNERTLYNEELQKLADEFCYKKNLPKVTVEREKMLAAYFNPFSRKIKISRKYEQKDQKDALVHELRHYFIDAKTKHIQTVLASPASVIASIPMQIYGYLQDNKALSYGGSVLWTSFFLCEAYADWPVNKKYAALSLTAAAIPWAIYIFTKRI